MEAGLHDQGLKRKRGGGKSSLFSFSEERELLKQQKEELFL